MHVILNSDVLYGDYVHHGVPGDVRKLVDACQRLGHTLLVPRTAMLEVERDQRERLAKALQELGNAYAILARHNLPVPVARPDEVVRLPDLLAELSSLGVPVEAVEATLEDFQDAHDRACLHLAPQARDTKSDEMRDLVIWSVACRVARRLGTTLLVSRDSVHTHHRGDAEATASGLVRVRSIEDALNFFEVDTPAGTLLRSLLAPSWGLLAEGGLPVGPDESIRAVRNIQFVQGARGPAAATGSIVIRGKEGQTINADVDIEVPTDSAGRVALTNVDVGGQRVADVVVPALYSPSSPSDADARLRELKRLWREE